MQQYQHVVVLMSILIGLTVTHLLKGAAQLYRNRRRVAPYWLHTAWVVLLLFFSFLIWWTFWNYRGIANWSFPRFVLYLSPGISLYFIAAMALPEQGDTATSMRDFYFANRRGIFGGLAAYGILAGLTAVIVRGLAIFDYSQLFRIIVFALAIALARSSKERVHIAGFFVFVALLVTFVLLFQFRLG